MTHKQPPVIGITCAQGPAAFPGHPLRLGQNQTYVHALLRAGAAPLLVPPITNSTRLRALYERLDGLLLSGGKDIDPARYGESPHEKCGPIVPERDKTELTLTRWALDEGKPLLAICRGIQVLNVVLGGSLYQDIGAQVPGAGRHDWYPDYPRSLLSHAITVAPGTGLAHILGQTSLQVNSLHHQALKEMAAGLAVVARAPDGIIEAVEATNHPFALGIQWHPEDLAASDPRQQRLFDTFAQACQS